MICSSFEVGVSDWRADGHSSRITGGQVLRIVDDQQRDLVAAQGCRSGSG
jgi:hypothetical protein